MKFINENKFLVLFYSILSCFFLGTINIPFFWDNVYIPILPPSLIDVLGAPLPYVVGLNAAEFDSILGSRHRPEKYAPGQS